MNKVIPDAEKCYKESEPSMLQWRVSDWMFREGFLIYSNHILLWKKIIIICTMQK